MITPLAGGSTSFASQTSINTNKRNFHSTGSKSPKPSTPKASQSSPSQTLTNKKTKPKAFSFAKHNSEVNKILSSPKWQALFIGAAALGYSIFPGLSMKSMQNDDSALEQWFVTGALFDGTIRSEAAQMNYDENQSWATKVWNLAIPATLGSIPGIMLLPRLEERLPMKNVFARMIVAGIGIIALTFSLQWGIAELWNKYLGKSD